MKTITMQTCPGYEEWRGHARACLQANLRPHEVLWGTPDSQPDLLKADELTLPAQSRNFSVPKDFLNMAEQAICHRSDDRFALLYRILWRICHENKNLLRIKTDDDVIRLHSYLKAVRRDAYKIKAFLRFREVADSNSEHFIAWYEPEHYSLSCSLPFFQTRFKNMIWTILTPDGAAHWDGTSIVLTDNPDRSQYPEDDNVEKYWLTYYRSTFNPARPKKQAMMNQMPKKYWKNMPETVLIEDMLRHSEERAREMIKAGQTPQNT